MTIATVIIMNKAGLNESDVRHKNREDNISGCSLYHSTAYMKDYNARLLHW